MEKIQMGKEYQTRDGRPVRVLAVDVKNDIYPVLALITRDGREASEGFTAEGFLWHTRDESPSDLIPVPQKHVRWVNFYNDTDFAGSVYFSKKEADSRAAKRRIARVRVEFEEGQFDE